MGTGREGGSVGILISFKYFNYIRRYLNKTSFTILILYKVNVVQFESVVPYTFLLYKRKLLLSKALKHPTYLPP